MNRSKCIVIVGLLLATLAACGAPATTAPTSAPQATSAPVPTSVSQATSVAASNGFPITIENCGQKLTFTKAPERVVTMSPHPAELLLALGLQDNIVGTGYVYDPVLPEYAAAYAKLNVLARSAYPSKEVVLNEKPDFVYGQPSAFTDDAAGTRDTLSKLGINTYVVGEDCATGKVSTEETFTDLRNLGKIFGVPQRAEALIASMQEKINGVQAKVLSFTTKPRVFFYDSGEQTPFTTGNRSLASWITQRAGGTHIFDDINDSFAEVNWETVIQRDPEFIFIIDYGQPTGAEKQTFLLQDTRLANITAIKNQQVYIIPYETLVSSVRTGSAVEQIATYLHPEAFK